tara:strand:- start:3293 stop:3454 length:162 start_codon:yes stop_codon:yes gene_type:complete
MFDGRNETFDAVCFEIGCVLLFDPSELNRDAVFSTMLAYIAEYINFDVSDTLR